MLVIMARYVRAAQIQKSDKKDLVGGARLS